MLNTIKELDVIKAVNTRQFPEDSVYGKEDLKSEVFIKCLKYPPNSARNLERITTCVKLDLIRKIKSNNRIDIRLPLSDSIPEVRHNFLKRCEDRLLINNFWAFADSRYPGIKQFKKFFGPKGGSRAGRRTIGNKKYSKVRDVLKELWIEYSK